VKGRESELKVRLEGKVADRERLRNELSDLTSMAGQQALKLQKFSPDSARAWKWICGNPQRFKDKIYGPPLVECTVKDPRYAAAVESILGRGEMIAFTATNREDWNTLRNITQNELKLRDIYSRVVYQGLDHFRPPARDDELNSYGLDEWAHNLVSGPEPVIAMLCDNGRLNRTGVSLDDQTDEQFEALKESPIQSWVAGRNSYRVNRRKEFGPSAVSTVVNSIRPAQHWASAGVDTEAQGVLHRSIRGIERELAELEDDHKKIKEELVEMSQQRATALSEKVCSKIDAVSTTYFATANPRG
jgi:hypothetical protein